MSDITTTTTTAAPAAVIDAAIERGIAASEMAGRMSRALAISGAINDIRKALTAEVMREVMALQGSAIGFKTDKDAGGGYPESVVRDCLIEAVLNGVFPVGNEFNIISGRAYITKEGMGRKLRDIRGLSYTLTPNVPEMKAGGAVVPMHIEWTHGNVRSERTISVCVKVNTGMGADAIIGKATRKARAWLYQTVTGNEIPDGEAEPAEINVTPRASPFEAPSKMAGAATPPPPPPPPSVMQLEDAEHYISERISMDAFNAWFSGQPCAFGYGSLRELAMHKAGRYGEIASHSNINAMVDHAGAWLDNKSEAGQ